MIETMIEALEATTTRSSRATAVSGAGERVDVPLARLGRSRGLPEEPPPGTGDGLRTFGPAVAVAFDTPAFEHPEGDLLERVADARDLLRAAGRTGAAAALSRFLDRARALGPERLQEVHGRTFELSPSCVLYLSVHLFGDGSFRRAHLMAGLAESQARAGFERGGELPDHLAVVLRFAPEMDGEEWRELVRFCLVPALPSIASGLEGTDNPYRHVLEAVRLLLEPAGEEGGDGDEAGEPEEGRGAP